MRSRPSATGTAIQSPKKVTAAARKKGLVIMSAALPVLAVLEDEQLGIFENAEADVAQIRDQRAGSADGLQVGELLGQREQRLDLGLRVEGLDLHGPLGLDDLLVGGGL